MIFVFIAWDLTTANSVVVVAVDGVVAVHSSQRQFRRGGRGGQKLSPSSAWSGHHCCLLPLPPHHHPPTHVVIFLFVTIPSSPLSLFWSIAAAIARPPRRRTYSPNKEKTPAFAEVPPPDLGAHRHRDINKGWHYPQLVQSSMTVVVAAWLFRCHHHRRLLCPWLWMPLGWGKRQCPSTATLAAMTVSMAGDETKEIKAKTARLMGIWHGWTWATISAKQVKLRKCMQEGGS